MELLFDEQEPKPILLRDYQSGAIEELRRHIAKGNKRVVLCAPTGAGKTVIAASILKAAAERRKYALFLVDRINLVDQTSAVLDVHGITHGIVQGKNPRWSPYEYVQVCSVQTLARRKLPRAPDLVVYDECHCQYKSALDYIAANPDCVAVGLTATPFSRGMGDFWNAIVNVRTTLDLMDDGFLVRPKIFSCKAPDDSEMSLGSDGEFTESSITKAQIRIAGDVVAEWIAKTSEFFGGPAKTIVFSATVAHGRELAARFAEAGFNFAHISYMDRDDEKRRATIEMFRRKDSELHGIISCGILTKGFDVPDAVVGISCRPYRKSLSGHMQEIGRVLRPAEGKDFALWLCHSGNVERFLDDTISVWTYGPGELDKASALDATARIKPKDKRQRMCSKCGGVLIGLTCSVCGHKHEPKSNVIVVDATMREMELGRISANRQARALDLSDHRAIWAAALLFSYKIEQRNLGYSDPANADMEKVRRRAYALWRRICPDAPNLGSVAYKMALPSRCNTMHWMTVAKAHAESRREWRMRNVKAHKVG